MTILVFESDSEIRRIVEIVGETADYFECWPENARRKGQSPLRYPKKMWSKSGDDEAV